jgi:hypothetical protein
MRSPRSAAPRIRGKEPTVTDTAYRLYWGDLHRQSNVSDGEGDLAEHFRVARDEAGLDFYAMTDHAVLTADPCDRAYMGPLKGPASITDARTPDELGDVVALHRISDTAWRTLQDLVRHFYTPERFVTLLGYEWSCARYGDRSVYYLADDQPIRVPRTLPELYRMLEGVDAMLTPHHTGYARGRRGTDWNVHNPILERNVEVVSLHGCSEEPRGGFFPLNNIGMGSNVPGGSVQDALARGYHLGLVGGSDGHRPRDPYVLTGAYAPALTRDALWDALYHRRTVATTGSQRTHLAFRMDGEWQGSLLALDTLPHFTIDAEGTAPITRVELIENGEVVQTWPGTGNRIVVNERLSCVPERPDNYYYVRLMQADGNLAWSSPIWVSYLPELPEARGYLYWLPRVEVRFEVVLEATPGPRSVVSLRCLNDDLERQSISAVTLDASGMPGLEPLDACSPADLAPGEALQRRFRLPVDFTEERSVFDVRYMDRHRNRRLVRRRYITHDGSARR